VPRRVGFKIKCKGKMVKMNKITFELANPMLLDKLNLLSVELTLPVETLVNFAVERLIKDVEFVRNLRTMGEQK
jgi:hypothetical protein